MRKLIRNPWTPLRALRTAALSFTLVAAGCEGEQGPKGDPGEQGPKGDSATVDPALSTVDKAFAGIGGKAAIQNFTLETTLQNFVFGEGFMPEDVVLGSTSDSTTIRYDAQGNRLSIRNQRTVKFLGLNVPQTFTEIINENRGYREGRDGVFGGESGNLLSDRTAAIRRRQRLLNPHLILKDVAADPSIARRARGTSGALPRAGAGCAGAFHGS